MNKQELRKIMENIIKILDGNIDWDNEDIIKVEEMNPHKRPNLPKGKMAIYMFSYKGEVLKVGKVGPKSKNRFRYQHYNPNSCESNLAKAILKDKKKYDKSLNESNVAQWMLKNLERTNIYLDEKCGIATLDLFEATLHYKLKPIYEGYETQNYY